MDNLEDRTTQQVKDSISSFAGKYRTELSAEVTKIENEMLNLTDNYSSLDFVVESEVKKRINAGFEKYEKDHVSYKRSMGAKIYTFGKMAVGGAGMYLALKYLKIDLPLYLFFFSTTTVLFAEGFFHFVDLNSSGYVDDTITRICNKYFKEEKASISSQRCEDEIEK